MSELDDLQRNPGAEGTLARCWPRDVPFAHVDARGHYRGIQITRGVVIASVAWHQQAVRVALVRPGESLIGPLERWVEVPLDEPETITEAIRAAWLGLQSA